MDQKPYPAEKARGGEIVLNTRLRRAIFLAGLVGTVIFVIIMMLVR
ncbi:peptide ABC transporter permease [Bradyrhizobium sp.]|nr:peptide ABC transporter permease [Bradyrhizobium sp.]